MSEHEAALSLENSICKNTFSIYALQRNQVEMDRYNIAVRLGLRMDDDLSREVIFGSWRFDYSF